MKLKSNTNGLLQSTPSTVHMSEQSTSPEWIHSLRQWIFLFFSHFFSGRLVIDIYRELPNLVHFRVNKLRVNKPFCHQLKSISLVNRLIRPKTPMVGCSWRILKELNNHAFELILSSSDASFAAFWLPLSAHFVPRIEWIIAWIRSVDVVLLFARVTGQIVIKHFWN